MLTNSFPHDNIYEVRESGQMKQAAVAQSVERRIGSAEVTGPIPVSSFFCAQKIINSRLYTLKEDFLSRIKGTERQTVALFF